MIRVLLWLPKVSIYLSNVGLSSFTRFNTAGFIPGDPSAFVCQLSEKIAAFAPQLTLDFIPEVTAAMIGISKTSHRISCVHYMGPWIKNLALFSNPTSSLYERSGARLRDCIRELSDMSANYPEVCSQEYSM